jgi:aspartyl-tRNA(Asn)/glutamyl-tRNA(Gln) amidotransferase subunit B
MQKGVMRIEPNVSVRPVGSTALGTRAEIKNLNSFRALERGVAYEIQRQTELLRQGIKVRQETVGWDDAREVTFIQRVKEGEDDYRYFPEPDLPPLVVEPAWMEQIRSALPELPAAKFHRFREQYGLNDYDAGVLVAEQAVADYFEQVVKDTPGISPKVVTNWVSGELFGLLNQSGISIDSSKVPPAELAKLVQMVTGGEINSTIAKAVLAEMFATGVSVEAIVSQGGLRQISDTDSIAPLVSQVLAENPEQVTAYLEGKETLLRWLIGQVMRAARGQANPQVVQKELERQLVEIKMSGRLGSDK